MIKKEELSKESSAKSYDETVKKKFNIRKLRSMEIFGYIGAILIFSAICIFITQNWDELNFITKVAVTLVSGIVAYVIGVLCSFDKRVNFVSSGFYLISAILIYIGLANVIFESIYVAIVGTQSLIFGILFGIYIISFIIFRKNIFIVLSVIFGSELFFFIIYSITHGGYYILYEYTSLLIGFVYILLGYALSKDTKDPLTEVLYGFGIFFFLSITLAFCFWSYDDANIFWILFYPVIIFWTMFFGTYLKIKSFILFGYIYIYMLLYIPFVTETYFIDNLGWPLSLAFMGVLVILFGFCINKIKYSYINKPAKEIRK